MLMSEILFDLQEIRKKNEVYTRRIEQMGGVREYASGGVYACSCSGGCDGGCEQSCEGRCQGCGKS